MTEKLLEYDRANGIRTYFEGDANTWRFRYDFDSVAPSLDYSKALQNEPEHWKKGVKQEMAHYAHIPASLLLKWHIEGVDITDQQSLFAQVNKREYSYLKTTNKIHVVRG